MANTRILYHGTDALVAGALVAGDILENSGLVFSATNRLYAAEYGETVLEVEVTFERLFDTREEEAAALWDAYVEENGGYTGPNCSREGYADDGLPFWENNEAVWGVARANGYDAILTSEGNERIGVGVTPAQTRKLA